MSHNPEKIGLLDQFLLWAQGEEAEPPKGVEDAPERAEFIEYLEYLDAHEYVDYGTYHQMRHREQVAKGLPPQLAPAHAPVLPTQKTHSDNQHRYRPGHLRRMIWLYRVASVAIAGVLMSVLFLVAMHMPHFGDPQAPALNEVAGRYLEQGQSETGALNVVAAMILDYRAFDTFGESLVLFAAAMSVILLLRNPRERIVNSEPLGPVFAGIGRLILPAIMLFGTYVVLNGHLSPGGGFSGGTILGCGLILCALVLGETQMEQLLPNSRITKLSVGCLLAYGGMKGYSFLTGANHIGWAIPKGTAGNILSAGFILPLNLCVGIIVACTIYTFYTLFAGKGE